jgi:hypothetical protein
MLILQKIGHKLVFPWSFTKGERGGVFNTGFLFLKKKLFSVS